MCIGESLHRTITPAALRDSKNGGKLSVAFCLSEYLALQGLKSDFGVMTTFSQSLTRLTSYLPTAQSVLGLSCKAVIDTVCSLDKQQKVLEVLLVPAGLFFECAQQMSPFLSSTAV